MRRTSSPRHLKFSLRPASASILCGAIIVLSNLGCTTSSLLKAAAVLAAAAPKQGQVRGGKQPVSKAEIQLYAVGTSGTASASTPLLATPVIADASGAFNIGGLYTCPSSAALVYLVATGGDPGVGSNNPDLAMLDVLGPCGSLTPDTPIVIDEVTTVAGVWALAPYMQSPTAVGSTAADPSLTAAFTLASNFADPTSGVTPGIAIPAGYTVPSSTIDTAADILAACINSTGGASGDGSACGNLFTYATVNGAAAPTNTIDAALAIATNPNHQVAAIFALLPTTAPFQPLLPNAPPNWTIALAPDAAAPVFSASTAANITTVTITDSTASAAIFYTADGSTPTSSSTRYTSPISLSASTTLKAIAVAGTYVSVVATDSFTVVPPPTKLVFLTQPTVALTSAELPVSVAIEDANGNIVPSASPTVTVALGANPTGTSLAGTTTVAPAAGIATFTTLSIPAAGTYTLTVSSASLASATSTPFTLTAPAPALPLVAARSADAFVDSVGMDVHFNYYGSIYTQNTPLMIQDLQALGVRHLRDGLCWQGPENWNTFYVLHQQLGALGFKTLYVPVISEPMAHVAAYPSLVPDMEAIESANEYDISGDPKWVATITAQQTAIHQTLRASAANANITILAPSLAYQTDAPALGNVAASADAGNLHGYFGGYNPGSSTTNPSIYLADVQPNTPGKPIWVTETGYFALPGPINGTYGVTPAVQAIYFPRLLLEYANAGAARTYLYELADDEVAGQDPTQFHWGLLNADGTPKPAFSAVANLLNLLSDPATAHSAAFTPVPLGFALQNAGSSVHQALFQKRDGSYYLALWVEASGWDFMKQQSIAVPTQHVTLQLSAAPRSASTTQWDENGNVVSGPLAPSKTLSLQVSDKLQIVHLVFPPAS